MATQAQSTDILFLLSITVCAMKLIASLTSPYVRKVRVVMAEKKLEYELILDDVWANDTITPNYNPLGKVPCLIMDDHGRLFDSRVIVEYLDTLSPVGRLIPQNGRDRAAVKCWEAIADGILDAAIIIRTELTQRPEHLRSQDWIDRQMAKITASLQSMDDTLGSQSFCMDNVFTLADIAVGCTLSYLDYRYPEIQWRDKHSNLARLYDKLASRPSFENTAPPAA